MIAKTLYRILRALLAACGVGLILISPLALEKIAGLKKVNWVQLSNIGQTYGAVSALISGVALAVVGISLILQSRSLAMSRMQITRTFHLDLMKFSIENPWLIPAWGYRAPSDAELEDTQRAGFVNMVAQYWITSYQIGTISNVEIREVFSQLFKGEVGRKWWIEERNIWPKITGNRKTRYVYEVISDEFNKAETMGPAFPATLQAAKPDQRDVAIRKVSQSRDKIGIALAFGAGIAVSNIVLRNRWFNSNR